MSFRYFFGWFGGLTTYNLVWFWFGPSNVTDTFSDGRYNPEAWSEYGLVAAILIFIGIIVTAAGTHKHIPDLIEPPERKNSSFSKVAECLLTTAAYKQQYNNLIIRDNSYCIYYECIHRRN